MGDTSALREYRYGIFFGRMSYSDSIERSASTAWRWRVNSRL